MLPEVKKVKLIPSVFPTVWQTVIFRNYGIVNSGRIAKILGCDEKTVDEEAFRLGLEKDESTVKAWEEKGYLTIIRNNWFLLSYSQIIELLDYTQEKLEFILEKEDFFSVKLGNYKPYCEEVKYFPLSSEQKAETESLAKIVKSHSVKGERPFDFFSKLKVTPCEKTAGELRRIIHGYVTPCGDTFAVNGKTYLPDNLLCEYQKQGINGLWLHGTLSSLSPYPFDENLSKGYQERRENLQELIDRCKNYGIKIYLYFNEPRALSDDGKYSHLVGRKENGFACLCLERAEVQKYLYESVKDLCTEIDGLGGIITITMSENPTHCNYYPNTNCPVCKNIPPEQSASIVNNIIYKAVKDSGCGAEVIANLWGWSQFMCWTEEQTFRGIDLLNKGISVMCVSEYDLEIEKGGVKGRIIDYSISNPGPSDITVKSLKRAKEKGHKIYAKIQVNNSWECSAVPYLPVFDLVYEHLDNLSKIGVFDYMLSWTLGGYPSPSLDLTSKFNADFNLDKWYEEKFKGDANTVHRGVKLICDGFREYPFSISSLYYSPKTLGYANLWEKESSQKTSTMVCFAYDDYETWTTPYDYETYISQYEKLLKKWKEGLEELKKVEQTEIIKEMALYGEVAYLHFKSDLIQTKYSFAKRNGDSVQMKNLASEDKTLTKELLKNMKKDSKIGFEASNHYYYTDRNLIEKIIQDEEFLKNN